DPADLVQVDQGQRDHRPGADRRYCLPRDQPPRDSLRPHSYEYEVPGEGAYVRPTTGAAGRGRRPGRKSAIPSERSGISNQTALPSLVGREPHRLASWSTRYRPRPPSSFSLAEPSRGSRRSVSNTSTHTAVSPRRSLRVNSLPAPLASGCSA